MWSVVCFSGRHPIWLSVLSMLLFRQDATYNSFIDDAAEMFAYVSS